MESNNTYRFLKLMEFNSLMVWDVKRQNVDSFISKFSFIKLSNILSKAEIEWVNIEDNKKYPILGVHSHGKGVYINRIASGKELTMKSYQKSKAYHLFYCKVRTVNGQWGIVYPEYENSYGSSNMQYLKIDYNKINPHYFERLLSIEKITNEWDRNAIGADGRHFNYSTLINLEIPLPTLSEQKRIVDEYNKKIKEAERLEKEAEELEKGIEEYLFSELGVDNRIIKTNTKTNLLDFINYQDIERWALSYILKNQLFSFKKVNYNILPLKSLLITFDGGKTPSTNNKEYWNGDVNWFSAKDMKLLQLRDSEDKITKYAVTNTGMKIHQPGTILGVFRSGILRHSFPVALLEKPATINQDLKAMVFDNNQIDNHYALYYMHVFQKLILEQAQKTGVTVESINSDEFMEIPFVVPPMEMQKVLTKCIAEMKLKISDLKRNAVSVKEIAKQAFENEIFNS